MKVCVISKADSSGGGASRMAEELAVLLNKAGHYAEHRAAWVQKSETTTLLYWRGFRRLHRYLRRVGFAEMFPLELVSVLRERLIDRFDLFHFHDISTAISPFTLGYIAGRKPVVWTFHDCSPFTGGCLNPLGCERYRRGCGKCPQVGNWPIDSRIDFSRLWHWCKRRVHRAGRLNCVTPSEWMADMAAGSGMIRTRPTVISNGVDSELFRPRDRHELRRKYNVPPSGAVVVVSAGFLSDRFKGVSFAADSILRNRDLDLCVVLVGHPAPGLLERLKGIRCISMGYVTDARTLAECYGMADLLLYCSLADNQPLTVMESLMSATPVLGFRTGGIVEMVEDGVTGYLVKPREIDTLSERLRTLCRDQEELRRMGENARRVAVEKYSHQAFVRNHLRLYENILSRRRRPGVAEL